MAYTRRQVLEATEDCLAELVNTIKKNKAEKKEDPLDGFYLRQFIREWARSKEIAANEIEKFVEEVRETVEAEVLTYGLTEHLLEEREVARERARLLDYSEVYTLYEPRRQWSSEKLKEDEV